MGSPEKNSIGTGGLLGVCVLLLHHLGPEKKMVPKMFSVFFGVEGVEKSGV